ncbi:uncharacterized protein HD556DRAFT_1240528 [Suillus plorans]|uniref:Uncharacterized protein n=1 Tax=Suillus plorans TaxID=116603 RepID=A0A9P7AC70_9AGAM|nr:uncharacterized protein HD556DRAFT_1248426 [Suillus plorans]XP_041158316.1 uncharacterized protein HD556DRAFT_1240528 [Suillus plorans]KAG1786345.1 hypothetical protein HD556DRAFT_1248426 [Suillus plorans]KAG1791510.1 hypothetical protein HD556DRAFT_1240528 [Suillus plorans]
MIREHGLLLTRRDTPDSDFYDVPTPEEVAAYDPTQGPCCTAERFRMDIRGFPKSAWNISAAKIFACSFQEAHAQFRDKAQREVERAWTTHLAYLKNVYQKQTSRARDIEAGKQRRRRKERRTQMYYRRMGVAEGSRHLRNDGLAIIKELGIDGMSSDESDHPPGNGIPVYQVRIKKWRSCKVTEILRACDALHLRMRYGGDWDASPGAWPHLRIPSLKYSTRAAASQLPSNFYSLNWFKSLNEFQRDALQPRIEEYSLEVPEQIVR